MSLEDEYRRLVSRLSKEVPPPFAPAQVSAAEPTPATYPEIDGLESIAWSEMKHAYGSAADLPNLLRALQDEEQAKASKFAIELYHRICHQGTLYEATAAVVPFLARLVRDSTVTIRVQLLDLLHDIGRGSSFLVAHEHSRMFWRERKTPEHAAARAQELIWVEAAHQAVFAQAETYLALLADHDDEVRAAVGPVLGLLPDRDRVALALREHWKHEPSDRVQAMLALSLVGRWNLELEIFPPAPDASEEFSRQMRDPRATPLRRVSAAIAVAALDPEHGHRDALPVFNALVGETVDEFESLPAPQRPGPVEWMSVTFRRDHARRAAWLLEMLAHPSAAVRREAVPSTSEFCRLWRGGPARLALPLARLLGDPDAKVRLKASYALPGMGSASLECLGLLRELTASADPDISKMAEKTIVKVEQMQTLLTQPPMLPTPYPIQSVAEWIATLSEPSKVGKAVMALDLFAEKARPALPALHRLLATADFKTCLHAARIIWKLEQDVSVVPFFLEALAEFGPDLLVLQRLEQMGAAAAPALPLLRAYLETEERPVRGAPGDERNCIAVRRAVSQIEAALPPHSSLRPSDAPLP